LLRPAVKVESVFTKAKSSKIKTSVGYVWDRMKLRWCLKRSRKTDSTWLTFAGIIALLICVAAPHAFAQEQADAGLTLAQAQAAVAQAQAAYVQAQAEAKVEMKSIVNCGTFSGAELATCRHEAAAQGSAINRRLADIGKVQVKAQSELNRQTRDAERTARAASASNTQVSRPESIINPTPSIEQPAGVPATSENHDSRISSGTTSADGSLDVYSKNCKAGDGRACFNLGAALSTDWKNDVRTRLAFQSGCQLHNRDSCYKIAAMYETGHGVSKDTNQARVYYKQGCTLGDADSCKRAESLSPAPLPSDPIDPALMPALESFLTLPDMADALTYVPGTMQITELVHYPKNPAYQRATVYFQAVHKWDGLQAKTGRNIEIRNGQPACVLAESGGVYDEVYYHCLPVYESADLAKIAGDQTLRTHMSADKRAEATLDARNRREPGTELNDADKACLKDTYETYYTSEQGACTQYFASSQGIQGCATYAQVSMPHTRTHVTNTCKRPLKFRDMCGNSYFGDHDVKPGAEFILAFPLLAISLIRSMLKIDCSAPRRLL
jgi:TPR repeat protein